MFELYETAPFKNNGESIAENLLSWYWLPYLSNN